jgi:hypothetical protein
MEFTTTDAHGRKKGGEGGVIVNVGCISVGDKVVVTGETKWPDEARDNNAGTPVKSRATHYTTVHDGETGYAPPTKIGFEWKGVVPHHPEDSVEGAITMEVGEGQTSRGLIEKVNVLAEIPPVLKKIVNMMGTNPYIYQVSLSLLLLPFLFLLALTRLRFRYTVATSRRGAQTAWLETCLAWQNRGGGERKRIRGSELCIVNSYGR